MFYPLPRVRDAKWKTTTFCILYCHSKSEPCEGIRRSTARKFRHGAPPFLIVSVEQVNVTLTRSTLCDEISVQDNT